MRLSVSIFGNECQCRFDKRNPLIKSLGKAVQVSLARQYRLGAPTG